MYGNGKYGYDVLSLDIHRGRDHGLPSYTAYRKFCGLKSFKSFDDFTDIMSPQVAKSLSKIYHHPEDVDLLVGGISEKPLGNALLGPTFSCIISDQMRRTRSGDRYFYTNPRQPNPFTKGQLSEIKKIKLSRIFCDNSDNIQFMQPNVFLKITERYLRFHFALKKIL